MLPLPSVQGAEVVPSTFFEGRFTLQSLLGRGGFGAVYCGVQHSTGDLVAIKLEKMRDKHSVLFHEARSMQEIQRCPTADGLPAMAWLKFVGQESNYRVLIMTLMGHSLGYLQQRHAHFSLKTTLMVMLQAISRLESVHRAGYIHRDLKPENLVMGLEEHKNRVYLIDFGLSSRYLCSDGSHRDEQSGKSFIGTARYASARTHEGFSQSRRDDIEQLVYVMIYLYRGKLPWSSLLIRDRDEKEHKIGSMKQEIDLAVICEGCPRTFVLLLNYARKMKFEEEPAYDMMRALLRKELMGEAGGVLPIREDCGFDWEETNSAVSVVPQPWKKTPAVRHISVVPVVEAPCPPVKLSSEEDASPGEECSASADLTWKEPEAIAPRLPQSAAVLHKESFFSARVPLSSEEEGNNVTASVSPLAPLSRAIGCAPDWEASFELPQELPLHVARASQPLSCLYSSEAAASASVFESSPSDRMAPSPAVAVVRREEESHPLCPTKPRAELIAPPACSPRRSATLLPQRRFWRGAAATVRQCSSPMRSTPTYNP